MASLTTLWIVGTSLCAVAGFLIGEVQRHDRAHGRRRYPLDRQPHAEMKLEGVARTPSTL